MLNRRTLLKAGGLSALSLGLNLFSPAFLRRRLLAGGVGGPKKMIFIFLRGGNDAANTVIPRGDGEYNLSNRPNLFIPVNAGLDLGNGFAQLHPALSPMMEIYNNSALNGVTGPGNLAVIHRVGYDGQSQSHFDSQQYWENGQPGNAIDEVGMIYRHIEATMNPATTPLVAAGINSSQLVSLRGPTVLPAFTNAGNFSFVGNTNSVQKFLGQPPSAPGGSDGLGLLGLYGGGQDFPGKTHRDLVYGTGLTLAESIDIVQAAINQGPYTPENNANYPSGTFGNRLEQAAMLMKRTPIRILGLNHNGFDTHVSQGGTNGNHANLLGELAFGMQALSRDLQGQWDDLLIVTMSEFSRTSIQNGSGGTDHGHAGAMFVAGGGVNGGVYNCDASTWADGDLLSSDNRYIQRLTDYRSVFGEIFTGHFGDSLSVVNQAIPGYDAAAVANPSEFNPLNFMV